MQKYTPDGDDPDVSGALSSVLWDVTLLQRHAHPGVVKIASEIASMSAMTESTMLLSLSPSDAIDLYSTREGGFRPAVQAPPKLAKRKAFKSAGPMSVSSFDDLAMPGGRINLEEDEISLIPESETVEISKHLAKEFRALKNFKENKSLRKELRRVTARLELHKSYVASKPRVNKVSKASKVDKALKPTPIISKKRKPRK
jgi:nucleolar complex protein 3